ncbi:GUN4 domain-containing protein [Lusitaniella coriacea LEGE 07157]|uniref:GUN4 domain-containing protein n=1 Tax=Lusitaniella coriacea LEGE 07157 TaxID=945747 RepID=A0A8J7DY49_9CYAN|nr:GUN4 domain-containing protein [Lusitaniella coriacea LEGE 07157]
MNDNWLYYNDLTFDLSAPKGHLPIVYGVQGVQWTYRVGWAREAFSSIFSHVKACEAYESDPLNAVELKSEKGADYTKLRELLRAKKWKEADEETARVMLEIAGRTNEGWLNPNSIEKFPCADLQTIDRLWVQASNGRFGFSVQKRIYQFCGGILDGQYYEEAWDKFGDRVGWRVNKNWLYYEDYIFDLSTEEGHLPTARDYVRSRSREIPPNYIKFRGEGYYHNIWKDPSCVIQCWQIWGLIQKQEASLW